MRTYRASALPEPLRQRLEAEALAHGKAVAVGPVFDTIKRAREGVVLDTIDRERLRWPLAWACTPDREPPADPPPAEWFADAVVVQ